MNNINVKLNKGEKKLSGTCEVPVALLREVEKLEGNTGTRDLQLLSKQLCKALESRCEWKSTGSSRASGGSHGIQDIIILVCL